MEWPPEQSVYDPVPFLEGGKARAEKPDPLDPAQITRRLRMIGTVLGIFSLVLATQLVRWQVLASPPSLEARAAAKESLPWRGAIVDCNGYPLALDIVSWKVEASPREVPPDQEEATAETLSRLTGVPKERLLQKLRPKEQVWTYLALGQSQQVRQAIIQQQEEGKLTGIYLRPSLSRYNPEGAATAHVLGIVNVPDDRRGCYGVEGYYDALLSSKQPPNIPASTTKPTYLPPPARRYIPSGAPADLVLTLDRSIQAIAAEELQLVVKETGARGGTVVIMDPKTGAILADFSLPTFDPGQYYLYAPDMQDVLKDPGVSTARELGSILKVLTMAIGLDSGAITPEETYVDTGCWEYGHRTLCNSGERAAGRVDMWQVLPQSLNLGAIYIADKTGVDTFYRYLSLFGLGRLTEVDLQSEHPGTMRHPGDPNWSKADLATNSYGQGMNVTPVQIAAAVSAIANRGLLMKPHAVSKVILGDRMVEIEPVQVRQVIKPETAQVVTEMMVKAVEDGARQAKVPGYTVAGKTGTAQIPGPGGYHPTDILATFVGFAPADDPRFVILVMVDRPSGPEAWGMYVAAPIFQRIAQRLFVYLGIPPDQERLQLQAASTSPGAPPRQSIGGEG